ncbi:MAG: hypothetical protein WCL39_05005 [Armatimonadota bacterium]
MGTCTKSFWRWVILAPFSIYSSSLSANNTSDTAVKLAQVFQVNQSIDPAIKSASSLLNEAQEKMHQQKWVDAKTTLQEILANHACSPLEAVEAIDELSIAAINSDILGLEAVPLNNGDFEDADEAGSPLKWLFSSTSPDVQIYVSPPNLIKGGRLANSDFKTGLPLGWKKIGSGLIVTVIAGSKHDADGGLNVNSSENNGVYQIIHGLKTGQIYHFRVWAKGGGINISVDTEGLIPESHAIVISDPKLIGHRGEWSLYDLKWKATKETATVSIRGGGTATMASDASVGFEKGFPLGQKASQDLSQPYLWINGKNAAVIDHTGLTGNLNAQDVTTVLYTTVGNCTTGKGYLFRAPIRLITKATQSGAFSIRIGIDPTGGLNWQSSDVIWSPSLNKRSMETFHAWRLANSDMADAFRPIFVSATAKADSINLFIRIDAKPANWTENIRSQVLVDDARLYQSNAPEVLQGYASGSSGLDLPQAAGDFAAVTALKVQESSWNKLWEANVRTHLADYNGSQKILDNLEQNKDMDLGWYKYQVGATAYNGGNLQTACKAFQSVLKLDVDDPLLRNKARFDLAHAYLLLNKVKEGQEQLIQILEDSTAPIASKAMANFQMAASSSASCCKDAVRTPSDYRKNANYLSAAREALGDLPQILHLESQVYGARALMLAGDKAAAKAQLQPVLTTHPTSGSEANTTIMGLMALIRLESESGDSGEINEITGKIINDRVMHESAIAPFALFYASQLQTKSGFKENATLSLETLITQYPDDDLAGIASEKCANLKTPTLQ